MSTRGVTAPLLSALAGLFALLVVPVLHGSLGHSRTACGEAGALEACVEDDADGDLGGESSETCPICLAASRSRSALPALPPGPAAAPALGLGELLLPEEPRRTTDRRHEPSAPRAPPSHV